jgi:hypothetical protein
LVRWHDASMSADLDGVIAALGDLQDCELGALIATMDDCPQFAPVFLAWIEQVCDWEHNRQQGLDFPLKLSDAANNPIGSAGSINTVAVSGRSRNAGSTETPHDLEGPGWSPAGHSLHTPGT